MSRRFGTVAAATLVLAACGCALAPTPDGTMTYDTSEVEDPGFWARASRGLGRYLDDRARDALDAIGLEFSVGPSLYAEVQVRRFLHVPLGLAVGSRDWYGLIDGRLGRRRPFEMKFGLPVPQVLWFFMIRTGGFRLSGRDALLALFVTHGVKSGKDDETGAHRCYFFIPFYKRDPEIPPTRRFDLTAELSALLRFRATLSPGEGLDFLLGIFGLDISGDDRTRESASEHPALGMENGDR